ncbi:dipeptide transport system permease [Actinobacillus pleuropneumoniae]|nr:dipeptide transport system permease [Actinobacillus pleuropneumoniae]
MLAYITKRLLSLIPVLAVVTIAIFLIIHITPGNPAAAILGMEASEEEIQQLNQDLGLDRPILEQYTSWVANVFKGDLGDSIFMNQPVSEAIAEHITPTLSAGHSGTGHCDPARDSLRDYRRLQARVHRRLYIDGDILAGHGLAQFLAGIVPYAVRWRQAAVAAGRRI